MHTHSNRLNLVVLLTFLICGSIFLLAISNEIPLSPSVLECGESKNSIAEYGFDPAQIDPDRDIFSQIEGLTPQSAATLDESLDLSAAGFFGFLENRGQNPNANLQYYFIADTYAIGFQASELLVWARLSVNDTWENINISFPGSSPVDPVGTHQLPHSTNFFNQQPVVTNVASWTEIIYPDLYPGISMRFYCQDQALKYDFLVSPGASPNIIQLKMHASSPVRIEVTPTYVVCKSVTFTDLTLWEDRAPIAYQENDSLIPVTFEQNEENQFRYGFEVGNYNFLEILVIDPVILQLSTFFGGIGRDCGNSIAVDDAGYIYITGYTSSTDFPIQNAFDSTFNSGTFDVFVTKFNPDGESLNFSTYLGGLESDGGKAIAVDDVGCIFVTGFTRSTNFPTHNAFDSTHNGITDVFVAKFNPDGQSLNFSTYLGGLESEFGYAITVDEVGSICITGYTFSTNFPTQNAFDSTFNGGPVDIFVTKFNPDGQSLNFSTYLGGSSSELGFAIAVDKFGYIYVTGDTGSTNFPTLNAFNSTHNGDYDVFITKFNSNGQSLNFSTYLGGSGYERGNAIALDKLGCIYITGFTGSINFPTPNACDSTHNGDYDVFITKINPDGQSLNFSTYLGGTSDDFGYGIAVDEVGCAHITGYTDSIDFPTHNSFDSTNNGGSDVFLTKFNPNGQSLNYSTYFGGEGDDYGYGIAVDYGRIFVAGYTDSMDIPTQNAFDSTFDGSSDGILFIFDSDTDGDGLTDYQEIIIYHTNPYDIDSDDDELTDFQEIIIYNTDPNEMDSDEDGLTDGEEVNTYSTDPNDEDSDDDGLTDYQEINTYFTDPNDADSDGDGLTDYQEINTYSTDPNDADSDGDGMPDGWEVDYDFDPLVSTDANLDFDGDGLSNLEEFQAGTNPLITDTDTDGMPDNWEVQYGFDPLNSLDAVIDSDLDNLTNLEEFQFGTHPLLNDTDSDGCLDGWEVDYGFDPLNGADATEDTDLDELTNLEEFQYGTHPLLNDTDADGMPDGWEVHNSLDPLVGNANGDPDTDGLINLAEFNVGTDPQNPDSDNDGLTDGEEVINSTDPLDADSDDDGLSDGDEIHIHSTDPNDADSDDDDLTDGDEINTHATDPNDTDSDDDGLIDGDEVNIYSTDPNNADSDGDGLSDGNEINSYSTDPNDADSDDDGLTDGDEINTHSTDPNNADSDDDGLTDGDEINIHGTDPNDADSDDDGLSDGDEIDTHSTDPNDADSDDDGLTDGEEINTHTTDPNDADSDDDGITDGQEIIDGTDPLDASDPGTSDTTSTETSTTTSSTEPTTDEPTDDNGGIPGYSGGLLLVCFWLTALFIVKRKLKMRA
jgi:hypothetical protein